MTDEEVEALAESVAQLPPEQKVDFLLGMLAKVSDERDRLRAELDGMKALVMQSVRAVVQTAEGTEDETNPVVVRMRQILEQLGDD